MLNIVIIIGVLLLIGLLILGVHAINTRATGGGEAKKRLARAETLINELQYKAADNAATDPFAVIVLDEIRSYERRELQTNQNKEYK